MIFKNLTKKLFGEETFNQLMYLKQYLKQYFRYSKFSSKHNKKTKYETHVISKLKKDGYVVIKDFIEKEQCKLLVSEMETKFKKFSQYIQHCEDKRIHGYDMLSKNANFFAKNDFINRIMNLYSPHTFGWVMSNIIEYKGAKSFGSGGGWHRDGYLNELKALIYLSDCNENNGCFHCIKSSHRLVYKFFDSLRLKLDISKNRFESFDSKFKNILKKRYKKITGKAGTLIIFDTSLLHSGSPIKSGKRYALTTYSFHKQHLTTKKDVENLIEHYAKNIVGKKIPFQEKIKKRLISSIKSV